MFNITVTNILDSIYIEHSYSHIIRLLDPNVVKRNTDKNCHVEHFFDMSVDSINSPKLEQIKSILDFSKNLKDNDTLLVHCHSGISRSTAIAILVLIQHGYSIDHAFKYIHDQVPHMDPNELILKHGDNIFALKEELISYHKHWCTNNNKPVRLNSEITESHIHDMKNIMNRIK